MNTRLVWFFGRLLILPAVCVVCTGVPAWAQTLDGDEVTGAIMVDSMAFVGDTVTMIFRIMADSGSVSALAGVYLDVPSGATVSPPEDEELDWFVSSTWTGLDRAFWGNLYEIPPGSSSNALTLRAVGYPGAVDGWLRGEYSMLGMPESDTVPVPEYPDIFTDGSVAVPALGIVPIPADTTGAGLLDRLATLATDACGTLGWITDSTTCTSIATDIGDADTAEAAADPTTADAELDAVLATLDSALGSGYTNTQGYWLLRSNIEIIQGKL